MRRDACFDRPHNAPVAVVDRNNAFSRNSALCERDHPKVRFGHDGLDDEPDGQTSVELVDGAKR